MIEFLWSLLVIYSTEKPYAEKSVIAYGTESS